ncbi:prolipoprotein diacylglyceryl transferase [Pelagicoccus sp. SDUM812003]|uniref:prolipoprotein diacylglyceryl transferase n=1 Tax=Pelagicoccus sp. SDUM812003 TaxID=3041267 RepID=UPI00280D2745|nr:prolipoprotein diacylglyceryl transferase [Pelagicoccus sp. SDUM812003]MDQ8202036.1 prolipoprotein diacylglyceryl transferase [Pelagicoccus sp. SDUM812003]
MQFPTWTHDLDPFIYQFSESWGIRWYGLAYVLGFLTGIWLLHIYYKKGLSPFDSKQQSDLFFAIVIGVIVGGRLGYFLFYSRETLLSDPMSFFRFNEGGMASHGGFVGVIIAAWIMARRFKESFLKVGDILATLAPPGLLFGRVANFINGELWGKHTDGSWGVIFPEAKDPFPRHPSQLYEAGLEGLVLLVYTQMRIWTSPVLKTHPGQIGGEFLLGYSIVRIIGEQFREPDAHIGLDFGFINRGALLSIFTALAGIAIIIWARKHPADARKRSA